MPPGKKESDATKGRADRFQWAPDEYIIVSQPDESEEEQGTVTSSEKEEEPPKRFPVVIQPGSPLDEAVQKQIAENKKAGKWGVGKSPLDNLHGKG